MVELRHFRYFLAVAEHRHFGRAAKALGIVQPALSMQIRSMEDEVGTPLFVRTSRKVELTAAGNLLIGEARKTITQAERAKEVVRLSKEGTIGTICIGFSGNASFVGKLTEDLRIFHRSSPNVAIRLHEMTASEQADAIAAGKVDIGYCPSFDLGPRFGLDVIRIGSWPWFVAMNADHALAEKIALDAADLADEPFVLYADHDDDHGQRDVLRAMLGRDPIVSHRVGNTLTVLTIAASGLGIGLIPAPLASVTLPGIIYRPLANQDGAADLVIISRTGHSSGAVEKFLALAQAANAT